MLQSYSNTTHARSKISENDFRIEPEITCKLLLHGERIFECLLRMLEDRMQKVRKLLGWIGFLPCKQFLNTEFHYEEADIV